MNKLKKALLLTLIPASFASGFFMQSVHGENESNGTYKVDGSYEVSIPTDATFDEYNKGTLTISGNVKAMHQLEIGIHSENDFNMMLDEHAIAYTIKDGDEVVAQDSSWSFPTATIGDGSIEKDNTFTKELSLSTNGGHEASGDYKDKLIFTLTDKQYYELNVTGVVENRKGISTTDLKFDVLVDNTTLFGEQAAFTHYVAEGTTYKVNNIIVPSNYIYDGETSYTGTVTGKTDVDIKVKQKNLDVYFDANGGTFADKATSKTVSVEAGKEYRNYFETVTSTDKVFVGWYTDRTDGTQVKGTDLIENDQSLYAHWSTPVTLQKGETFRDNIPSGVTKVVFTTEKAPSGTTTKNLAADGSNAIVGWTDGTTYYVSTQDASKAISFNEDSSYMFSGKESLKEIDFGDVVSTANVTNMYYMFQFCTGLEKLDLSSFDTSKVTNMEAMFSWCSSLECLDLSSFNTSRVTNMRMMTQACKKLQAIFVGDGFSTENVTDGGTVDTNMSYLMFNDSSKLPNYVEKTDEDKTYAKTVRNNGYLYVNGKTVTFDANGGTISDKNGENASSTVKFYVESGQPYSTYVGYSSYCKDGNLPEASLTDKTFIGWYTEATGGTKITTDTSTTTNTTYYAHYKSYTLNAGTTFNSTIPTSATKIVFTTYDQIPSDKSLVTDLSTIKDESVVGWQVDDTYYVSTVDENQPVIFNKDSARMFASGSLATASRFTSITFSNNVDTSNVEDFSSMFETCSNLTELDVSGFDTSSAVDMSLMFYKCENLKTLTLSSKFDTSNVTNMYCMFALCSELETVDLSSFNTSKVTNMSGMFSLDTNLSRIYASSTFDVTNVTKSDGMFRSCSKLDNYDARAIDKTKAISIPRGGYLYLDIVTVNFHVNMDGATCETTTKLVEKGQTYGEIPTPVHAEYGFNGWYTKASGGSVIKADTVVTANVGDTVDLYAHWKTYTLNPGNEFLGNCGITRSDRIINKIVFTTADRIPEGYTIANGKLIDMTGKRDYSVVGWMDGTTCYISPVDEGAATIFNQNCKGMFNWESWATRITSGSVLTDIEFNNVNTSHVTNMLEMFKGLNGLTSLDLSNFDFSNVTNTTQMFCNNTNLEKIIVSSEFDLSKITQYSNMFLSSKKLPGYDSKELGKSKAVSTRDGGYLYVNPHTLTFDANGGTCDTTSMIVEEGYSYGSPIQSLPLATREGYVFAGWYTDKTSGTRVTNETIFEGKDDVTLYAHWASYLLSGTDLNTELKKNTTITSVVFTSEEAPSTAIVTDLSTDKNGTIVGWVDDTTYKISTQNSDVKVIFNSESANMFAGLTNITSISFDNVDTSLATDMSGMFAGCSNLASLDISKFDTSIVHDTKDMFKDCEKLTSLDVSTLNTSKVTDMSSMFAGCKSLTSLDVSKLDTSKVVNMNAMFSGDSKLTTITINGIDTSSVTNMSYMFNGCTSLQTLDISGLNTASVTDMSYMFNSDSALTSLNVSNIKTSAVTDFTSMFADCSSLTSLNLSSFDTSNVEKFEETFKNCSKLTSLDLSKFNTSNATSMKKMFSNCTSLTTLDLTNFNTSKVTDMTEMFYTEQDDDSLKTIYVTSKFAIGDNTTITNILKGRTGLPNYKSTKSDQELAQAVGSDGSLYVDARNVSFNTNGVDCDKPSDWTVEKNHKYSEYGTLPTLPLQSDKSFGGWYTAASGGNEVTGDTVYTSDSNTTLYAHWIDLTYTLLSGEEFNKKIPSEATSIVFTSTTEIPSDAIDLSKTSDKSVLGWLDGTTYYISASNSDKEIIFNEDASKMFFNKTNISSIEFNNIDTSKVTTMAEMFKGCSSLTSIDVSNVQTSSVTSMESMFEGCTSLTDVNFGEEKSLKFHTDDVTTMKAMFKGCSSLEHIDVSLLSPYEVTTTEEMFAECTNLTKVEFVNEKSHITYFHLYKVENMSGMFKNCTSLVTLDLENFTTHTATNMSYMFSGDTALNCIAVGGDFSVEKVTESMSMFANCRNLPNYTSGSVNKDKAKSASEGGYLYVYPYTVTFDASGGTLNGSNTKIVEIDKVYGTLPTATKENSEFIGWFTAKDGGKKVTSEDTFSKDDFYWGDNYTLYAHWGINYQLVDGEEFNGLIPTTSETAGTTEPTSIVFTTSDQIPTDYSLENGLTDFSVLGNGSVVGWQDGTTYYISTTASNQPVIFNSNSSGMFSELDVESITFGNNVDTSHVENMTMLFDDCVNLKSITFPDNFVTSSVTNLTGMFYKCTSLESLDLSKFDTSNVKQLSMMFFGCTSLKELNVSSFNTSSVVDDDTETMYYLQGMSGMFYYCTSLKSLDLSSFDTSNVKSMMYMFGNCNSLETLTLSSTFDTSNVTNMVGMFGHCEKLSTIDISSFNTKNVTNMSEMFADCTSLTSIVFGDNFNTGKVTDMSAMFGNCSSLVSLDLSKVVDTSKVTNFSSMFEGCTKLSNLTFGNGFATSSAKNMSAMFKNCSSLTSLELESFITISVTDMSNMFNGDSSLVDIYVSSNNFRTTSVTSSTDMFKECENLPNFDSTKVDVSMAISVAKNGYLRVDAKTITFDPNGGTIKEGSFSTKKLDLGQKIGTLPEVDDRDGYTFNGWYTSYGYPITEDTELGTWIYEEGTTMYAEWGSSYKLKTGYDFRTLIPKTDTEKGTTGVTSIVFTSEKAPDGAALTDVSSAGDKSVVAWQDDTTWYVSTQNENQSIIFNEYSAYMFAEDEVTELESITFNNVDTSNVTNMSGMFTGCEKLAELNLPDNFVTSNVTILSQMFAQCSSLTSLDVSKFNTSNVTDMYEMFAECSSLTSLDLSSFNTSNVTDMYAMFRDCEKLESINVSGFNTLKVEDMDDMFSNCKSLTTLDLSSFDMSNMSTEYYAAAYSFFDSCNALTTVYVRSDTEKDILSNSKITGVADTVEFVIGSPTTVNSNDASSDEALTQAETDVEDTDSAIEEAPDTTDTVPSDEAIDDSTTEEKSDTVETDTSSSEESTEETVDGDTSEGVEPTE